MLYSKTTKTTLVLVKPQNKGFQVIFAHKKIFLILITNLDISDNLIWTTQVFGRYFVTWPLLQWQIKPYTRKWHITSYDKTHLRTDSDTSHHGNIQCQTTPCKTVSFLFLFFSFKIHVHLKGCLELKLVSEMILLLLIWIKLYTFEHLQFFKNLQKNYQFTVTQCTLL